MAMIHHKPMSRQIIHLPRCFWHEAPPAADPREQAVSAPQHAPVADISPLGRLHLAEDRPQVMSLIRARQAQREERRRALNYFDEPLKARYQREWAEEQARELETWTAQLAEAISQVRFGCPVACLPLPMKIALEAGTRQLLQLLDGVQE